MNGKVYQYDLDGNFVKEYANAASAAHIIKTDKSTLCACLKGKTKTHCDSYWSHKMYIKLPKTLMLRYSKIYQYDDQMNLINIFDRVEHTSRFGFDESSVVKCLKGKLKTHRGYIWKLKD
jgi:CRISPR/Cas system endoribonuclease Cas6 (RAMP superfamily)